MSIMSKNENDPAVDPTYSITTFTDSMKLEKKTFENKIEDTVLLKRDMLLQIVPVTWRRLFLLLVCNMVGTIEFLNGTIYYIYTGDPYMHCYCNMLQINSDQYHEGIQALCDCGILAKDKYSSDPDNIYKLNVPIAAKEFSIDVLYNSALTLPDSYLPPIAN